MSSKTERITLLADPAFKASLTEQAEAAGVSVSAWIRLRCEAEEALSPSQARELAMLLADLNAALDQTRTRLDALQRRTEAAQAEIDAWRTRAGSADVTERELEAVRALLGLRDEAQA